MEEMVKELSKMSRYEQDYIIERFVAQQRNKAAVSEMNRQAEARTNLILHQMKYDFAEARRINAESK